MSNWIAVAAIVVSIGITCLNYIKIQQVHVLVNSNLTAVMDKLGISTSRNQQLENAMKDSGTVIPEKTADTGNPPA